MKVRSGFVSNSSSSSFIVAFPRKPKSVEDVHKFMFNGLDGVIEYSDDNMLYRAVAERVFDDFQKKRAKLGLLARMVDILSSRYDYSPNLGGGGVFWASGQVDSGGGSWSCRRDRYFGSDDKLMREYADFVTKCGLRERDLREKLREIEERKFTVPKVKFAYKGGISSGKKKFTKDGVRAYDAFKRELAVFQESDGEYVVVQKELDVFINKKFERDGELRLGLARVDGGVFVSDNLGKFIFVVSYADDSGEGLLEHGGIFRGVPHIVVNNH